MQSSREELNMAEGPARSRAGRGEDGSGGREVIDGDLGLRNSLSTTCVRSRDGPVQEVANDMDDTDFNDGS